MKKKYLEPETKWLQSFGDEYLMQEVSPTLDVNDNDEDEDEDDFDNLLSKPGHSVWED